VEYSTAWRCSIASTDPTLGGSTLKHEGRRQTDRRAAYAGSRLKLIDASGRSRLIRQPFSRNGENSPYGMLGGIVETSASFEARSAPRSYPTGQEPLRPRAGGGYRLVSVQPASNHPGPARPSDDDDAGPLCLLRHLGQHQTIALVPYQVVRIWKKWLSRRDRRRRLHWDRLNDLLTRHPLPAARIVHRYTAASEALP